GPNLWLFSSLFCFDVVNCPCPTTTIEARDHRLAPIDLHRDCRRSPQLPLQRHRHPLGSYIHQPPGHPVVRETPSRSQAPQLKRAGRRD
ncbi:hypothetical protein F5H01DRAFT_382106, partial [Linnemannia elongata]